MTETKKCVIYARFSPRPDAAESDSAEKQIEICREYAQQNGYEVVGEFVDKAKSRNDANREGLIRAIDSIKRGQVLLCYDLSRFGAGHTAIVYEQDLIRRGGSLEVVDGPNTANDPDTKMLRTIMFAFKEREREMIAERTRIKMLKMQREGRSVSGHPPYGYTKDPNDKTRLIKDPDEYPVLEKIISLYEGGMSMSGIAKKLDETNVKSRRGNGWHATTIRRSLVRTGKLRAI